MCGIVLAGGNLSSTDLEIFNQLLYCDVFRGQHSTGVFAKRKGEKEVTWYKEALPSYAYLLEDEYKELSRGKGAKYATAPSWMVGHNRHATRGAVNSRNAHPFHHGKITLVHNGTLTNQSLLPDSKNFEVDSENICWSIDKIGAEATIQKLDGAFTLIWHDANDDTLHIIRNDERPFHLARVGQDWFGASEEDMLMWILKRSKSHKNRIQEHFECKVGVEYIFDVSKGTMVLSEEKEHKLPVFTMASRWGNYYGTSWQDGYHDERFERHDANQSASSANASHEQRQRLETEKQNAIAIKKGLEIRRDQMISFTPSMYEPYQGEYSKGKGKMTGFFFDDKPMEYVEIDVHNITEEDFNKALTDSKTLYRGTIACINEVNSMVRCIITRGEFLWGGKEPAKEPEGTVADQFDDDIPFDMNSFFIHPKSGVKITRKFWESHAHGECGGCGKHIDWEEAPKAVFAYQAYWHEHCLKTVNDLQNNELESEVELVPCCVCGHVVTATEIDTKMSSYRQEDICKKCAKAISEKAKSTTIKEGYVWHRYTDVTNSRRPENSIRVDAAFIARAIIMAESVKKEITLEDIPECYIEKRAGGMYAIGMLPDGVKSLSPREDKEAATNKVVPFRHKAALRVTVKSLDGSKEAEFTKALWTSLAYCEYCYKPIPWRDAEKCTLSDYNRIVCPSPTCRGKLNGSQKTTTR